MPKAIVTGFLRPVTLEEVRNAGVVLAEEPADDAPLGVQCTIAVAPHAPGAVVRVNYAVVVERASGGRERIMARLEDADGDANVERARRLFDASQTSIA